eukprot:TRINITY_DN82380_c0_g1_i1.p1 TRINITY_DN82380_c0_g1~~TRINITY_DN82380_c0_g1_i1.p1  ORF type:complete len:1178 (-),score=331.73 TRINITY_DN82380_c0_g1_i1:149-3682(-)
MAEPPASLGLGPISTPCFVFPAADLPRSHTAALRATARLQRKPNALAEQYGANGSGNRQSKNGNRLGRLARGVLSAAAMIIGLSATNRQSSLEHRGFAGLKLRVFRQAARIARLPRKAVATAVAATEDIVKPDLDKRNYRFLTLPNGLQVLLASDPEADAAAASMSIKTGSFDDPPEYLGLAHFHEHMLFLGTEKFPDESEYEQFLKDRGGYSNAYTADELTNYYFRVNAPHLEGALDRFSQFFIAPTFDLSSVEREMRAVDSESTNYASDEGWRRIQVMKATAEPSHPFHKFSVGNLGTLGHSGPDTAREVLLKWNKEHYHTGIMRLAIAGKESLDELERMVKEYFSAVPSLEKGAEAQSNGATSSTKEPWSDDQLGRYYEIVPKIDERSIGVYWPLPPATKHLYGKVEAYLSTLLGHEGDDSLHALLNREGLIESLSAGPQLSFSDGQLMGMEVGLTLEGERRMDEVLDGIFAYLAVIREAGPKPETYDELKNLSTVGFRFREESPAPENFAASATATMHYYPPKDLLRGPGAYDEWLPEEVEQWTKALSPEKAIVVRVSPDLETPLTEALSGLANGDNDLPDSDSLNEVLQAVPASASSKEGWMKERWYGARFRGRKLTAEELAKWSSPPKSICEQMAPPQLNPFVPSDFSLLCDKKGLPEHKPKTAMEITPPVKGETPAAESLLTVWTKTDCTYRMPKVSFNAHIMTPVYSMGPEAVVALRIFCGVLSDDLNAYAYDASTAGLSYGVDFSDRLTFAVGGFSHKLPELLQKVASRLRSLLNELVDVADGAEKSSEGNARDYWLDRVEKEGEVLLRGYENFYREDPIQAADYNMRQALLQNMWHLTEYMDILKKAKGADLLKAVRDHVPAALAKMQVEVLAHGNVDAEAALDMAKILRKSLTGETAEQSTASEDPFVLPDADVPRNTVALLPEGPQQSLAVDFDLEATNPIEENSAILNVYQTGPYYEDGHKDACIGMVAHLADTSAFQQLRTKEQLGYVAHAGYHRLYDVDGLSVLVQGPRLPPAGLDDRIEAWLVQFRQELEDMEEEAFRTNVASVVQLKSERDKQLGQETGRHWSEIAKRTYRFGKLQKEIDTLSALSKADVIAFFDKYLAADAPHRRKLSSRVYGGASRTEEQKKVQAEALERQKAAGLRTISTLDEVREFKKDLPTHSVG